MSKLIAQGAEAKIYKNKSSILKDRFLKTYRHPELDRRLRKSRTKREAKVMLKVKEIIPTSKYISHDEDEMNIEMEYLPGDVLKNVFEKNYKTHAKVLGKNIALLHKHGIIHGDLTTSNMIVNKEIHVIDFGLSFFSDDAEDMAVDLHLLKQALESKHYEVFESAFDIIKKEYSKHNPKAKEIIERLKIVEKRGRYKQQH
ncbi:Kae1-associated serine/threonine protein kinase [Candidatus Woesearchaeota archaeon]|nr:Kae1-associated serine/threonine protein kinase [Candidatus Woesearchaeota archaeon]